MLHNMEEITARKVRIMSTILTTFAIVGGLALPAGMLLGRGLVGLVAALTKSNQSHFPVVIQARSYAWAAVSVLAAGLASALVVRRHIDRLNLVAALKTRD